MFVNLIYFFRYYSTKNEVSYMDYLTYPNNQDDEYQNGNRQALQRKRSLRSNKSTDAISNGNTHQESAAKAKPSSRLVFFLVELIEIIGGKARFRKLFFKVGLKAHFRNFYNPLINLINFYSFFL